MTPDQINAAIAETQGWKWKSRIGQPTSKFLFSPESKVWKSGYVAMFGTIVGEFEDCERMEKMESFRFSPDSPNYHGSLDAIVPVVRAMPERDRHRAIMMLCHITLYSEVLSAYVATPAQWCEAYLKVKGLWK